MSYRDVLFMALGWQLAIAVRFAADAAFDRMDRRKTRRRTLAVEPTAPPPGRAGGSFNASHDG